MSATYTLYGSYASYYTAKIRSYLRKKGVPFVERLPSDPVFREKVRPVSGSHRIPQLLTPEGEVIQDSITIVDTIETRFPALPAFPETPLQRTFVHLMELMGSEALVRLAWLHRWLYDENRFFVEMDFGRSFRPQGTDAELRKYGRVISDRMMSYGLPESTPDRRAALDDEYRALLRLFEAHLIEHPYLVGGHPSAADHAVMGALHAHMGRDPAGLRLMQDNAPRTFRWVEHMMTPEVESPEWFHREVAYPANDEVPETALAILRFIAANRGEPFVLSALAFQAAMARVGASAGHAVAPDADQPHLEAERVEYAGKAYEHSADVYTTWVAQRAQRHFQAQPDEVRSRIESAIGDEVCVALLRVPAEFPLERVANRFVIGDAGASPTG